MPLIYSVPITIPTSESGLSDPKHIGNYKVIGFIIPDDFITAPLTFRAGITDLLIADVYNQDGDEATIDDVTAGRTILLKPDDIDLVRGCPWLQLRSGTAAEAVDQTSDPEIIVLLEDRS